MAKQSVDELESFVDEIRSCSQFAYRPAWHYVYFLCTILVLMFLAFSFGWYYHG